MRRVIAVLALLQLAAIAAAQSQAIDGLLDVQILADDVRLLEADPTRPAAITIGDSITFFGYNPAGWVDLLQKDYPQLAFVNQGASMGTTRRSLADSRFLVGSPKSPFYNHTDRIAVVTFCLGANDASIKPREPNWRAISEAEYKQNLVSSIQAFKSLNVNNILLLTPPPAASPPRIDRSLNVTGTYASIVKEVGQEMHVPVVDIFSAIQAVPQWQTAAMVADGLHLGPLGNQVVYEGVRDAMRTFYPGV